MIRVLSYLSLRSLLSIDEKKATNRNGLPKFYLKVCILVERFMQPTPVFIGVGCLKGQINEFLTVLFINPAFEMTFI